MWQGWKTIILQRSFCSVKWSMVSRAVWYCGKDSLKRTLNTCSTERSLWIICTFCDHVEFCKLFSQVVFVIVPLPKQSYCYRFACVCFRVCQTTFVICLLLFVYCYSKIDCYFTIYSLNSFHSKVTICIFKKNIRLPPRCLKQLWRIQIFHSRTFNDLRLSPSEKLEELSSASSFTASSVQPA